MLYGLGNTFQNILMYKIYLFGELLLGYESPFSLQIFLGKKIPASCKTNLEVFT